MQGEYRGDFTRDTFYQFKHLSRVLKQQGRVDLEANWNEQMAILLHYWHGLARDLIGQHGGPAEVGSASTTGFEIDQLSAGGAAVQGDFSIHEGHYYVDGILCELDASPASIIAIND